MMRRCKILLKNDFSYVFHTLKRHGSLFCISDEVRQAFLDKKAVVALESTIITHGMKFPYNYETAREVENLIREQNVVPATIAVIKGKVKVGLNNRELEGLASNQTNCIKISRRDFPYVISQNLSGGTTVSGTMVIAHKVGIPIFVTGGIGGVHRDGQSTMDISADLTELGKTPVAVISSGVKSILDIERTLEYLETQGVAVATYGQTKTFPSFYCRRSDYNSPYNLTSVEEAARFVQTIFDMKLNSGILIAVPIPEEYSLDEKAVESAIKTGLKEAKKENIKGKDITPFLLNKITQITEGESLKSNIELIKNNALIGGRIALKLSKIREQIDGINFKESVFDFGNVHKRTESVATKEKDDFKVVVVGGTNLDFVVSIRDESFKPKAVFFTCIDSRMIPTRFTETCVGDMFVVRNAGNVIPHSRYYPDEVTTNEPAALELGCLINDVRHIIVCGHSDCKAMNLLYSLRCEEYSSQTNRRISPLRAWMCAHASSSLERFLKLEKDGMNQPLVFQAETPLNKFVAYIDPENKFKTEDKLSQVNTLQQLQNIASYGFLRDRLERRDLHIHALWFDIYTGDIYYFSRCSKQFVEVNEESITSLLREIDGQTIGGKIEQSGGGVARNIADALGKLQMNPFLVSAVGNEQLGEFILERTIPHLNSGGIVKLSNANTGTCMVLCDHTGEFMLAVGDMAIHDRITASHVRRHEATIANSSLVVLDGNLNQETTEFVLRLCAENSVPVWFEPTDVYRASKPFINKNIPFPTFISPNYKEFQKIFEAINPENGKSESSEENQDQVDECIRKGYLMAKYVENIIITMGKKGVLVIRKGKENDPFFTATKKPKYIKPSQPVSHRLYEPELIPEEEIVNVSGAGDCFASGFIAAMLKGAPEKSCIESGFKCSSSSLKSSKTVPPNFDCEPGYLNRLDEPVPK